MNILRYVKKGPANIEGGTGSFALAALLYWKMWAFALLILAGGLLPQLVSGDPLSLVTGYSIGLFAGALFAQKVGFE